MSFLNIRLGWTVKNAPLRGFGNRGGKHQNWAKNSINERWYSCGGDFAGSPFESSYRQDMYSVDLAAYIAGDINSGWAQEQAYCRPDGLIQPKHPDHIGWQWDSKRKVFVMIPGLLLGSNDVCAGETTADASDILFLRGEIMAFDPVTRAWTKWAKTGDGRSDGLQYHAKYDAPRDRFVQFHVRSTTGSSVQAYSPGATPATTGMWTTVRTNLRNSNGKAVHIEGEQHALDTTRWQIYGVDYANGHFHRYDLPTDTMTDVCKLDGLDGRPPWQASAGYSFNACVYDALHDIVWFFPYYEVDPTGRKPMTNLPLGLYAYHLSGPLAGKWETVSVATSIGPTFNAIGRVMFHDDQQNALVLYGTAGISLEPQRDLHYFFHRYAGAQNLQCSLTLSSQNFTSGTTASAYRFRLAGASTGQPVYSKDVPYGLAGPITALFEGVRQDTTYKTTCELIAGDGVTPLAVVTGDTVTPVSTGGPPVVPVPVSGRPASR